MKLGLSICVICYARGLEKGKVSGVPSFFFFIFLISTALTAAKEEALWASSETRTRDRQILDIEDRLCSTQRQVNDLQKQLDEKDKTMTQGREDADRLAGSQKAALET